MISDPSYVQILQLAVGALAVFLIGLNMTLLVLLRHKFVHWFQTKIVAVTFLLFYVALKVSLYPVHWPTLVIGLIAVNLDFAAFIWLWYNISKSVKTGIQGQVPLFRDPKLERKVR